MRYFEGIVVSWSNIRYIVAYGVIFALANYVEDLLKSLKEIRMVKLVCNNIGKIKHID